MFTVNDHFYFGTHKKMITAFGDFFNNMYIKRVNDAGTVLKNLRVPLSFAPRNKFISRLGEDYAKGGVNVNTSLPRLSFDIGSPALDEARMKSKLGRSKQRDDLGTIRALLNPVPYDFPFTLRLWVKSLDDAFQISEQILATFMPELNTQIIDIPEINLVSSVPVILEGNEKLDEYEGSFGDFRVIEWEFNFTMKGYIYRGLSAAGSDKVIKQVNSLLYQMGNNNDDVLITDLQSVVDPLDETLWDDAYAPTNVEIIDTHRSVIDGE
jgi:hypothetical protein